MSEKQRKQVIEVERGTWVLSLGLVGLSESLIVHCAGPYYIGHTFEVNCSIHMSVCTYELYSF